jgi:hypothetical protein
MALKGTERNKKSADKFKAAGGKYFAYRTDAERVKKMAQLRAKHKEITSDRVLLDFCLDYVHSIVIDGVAP